MGRIGGYFNPRAPCGARPDRNLQKLSKKRISIHAPLAGHDSVTGDGFGGTPYFNPRAPCGARHGLRHTNAAVMNFNPRAPCGARRASSTQLRRTRHFNPRAPCGARRKRYPKLFEIFLFQSTRPLRGTTQRMITRHISSSYFNPRAPCGARQQKYTNYFTHFCEKSKVSTVFAKNAPFKALFRLRISKNISNRGANHHRNFCALLLRTTRSLGLPEGMSACSQSARSCFHTFFPGSKIAG